jgi:FtsX-like permease family
MANERILIVENVQVWGLVTAQSGMLGLLAGVLAVSGGLLLAWVLVFVVNRRSFGWTMPIELSPLILLQGVLLSVLAAVLAWGTRGGSASSLSGSSVLCGRGKGTHRRC